MRRDELFPSRYLKGPDLNGKAFKVVIDRLEQAKNQKGERMTLVFFRGAEKALILKPKVYDQIVGAIGEDDTGNWPGKAVTLYPDVEVFNGQRFDVVRVRGDVIPVAEPEFVEDNDELEPPF